MVCPPVIAEQLCAHVSDSFQGGSHKWPPKFSGPCLIRILTILSNWASFVLLKFDEKSVFELKTKVQVLCLYYCAAFWSVLLWNKQLKHLFLISLAKSSDERTDMANPSKMRTIRNCVFFHAISSHAGLQKVPVLCCAPPPREATYLFTLQCSSVCLSGVRHPHWFYTQLWVKRATHPMLPSILVFAFFRMFFIFVQIIREPRWFQIQKQFTWTRAGLKAMNSLIPITTNRWIRGQMQKQWEGSTKLSLILTRNPSCAEFLWRPEMWPPWLL